MRKTPKGSHKEDLGMQTRGNNRNITVVSVKLEIVASKYAHTHPICNQGRTFFKSIKLGIIMQSTMRTVVFFGVFRSKISPKRHLE